MDADGRASETKTAPTERMPMALGAAAQKQAVSQLPAAASAAGVSKRPQGSSERASSGQPGDGEAAFEAALIRPPEGTQRSAEQVSISKVTSRDSTNKLSAEGSAQGASSQPMACDEGLHHLLPPPEGAAQAACQHSSASQGASRGAASCAKRPSSSSIAQGAASQGAAILQEATLSSNRQASGSQSSPGRVLSLS